MKTSAVVARHRGLWIALLGAVATAGCDFLYRMERTAAATEMPPGRCIVSAVERLPWVESVSQSDSVQGVTVAVVPKAGALPFEIVTRADFQPSNKAGSVRLAWSRMNRRLGADEMRILRLHMESAYRAMRSHCPGLPDWAAVPESCDACSTP